MRFHLVMLVVVVDRRYVGLSFGCHAGDHGSDAAHSVWLVSTLSMMIVMMMMIVMIMIVVVVLLLLSRGAAIRAVAF